MIDTVYVIEKYNIVDALNDIEAFVNRMEKFKDKHPNYRYNIDIGRDTKDNPKWSIELKINKDEPENIEVS